MNKTQKLNPYIDFKTSGVRLVASDLDGTLLNKDGLLSEANRQAIKRLKENGFRFAIATGRPYFSVPPLLSMWGLEGLVDVIIANNGLEVGIQASGEILIGERLAVKAIHDILDLYKPLPGNFCVYMKGGLYGQENDDFMIRVSAKNRLEAHVGDLKELITTDQDKLLLALDPEDLQEIEAFYQAHPDPSYRGFASQDYLFEFMHPSVNKLNGIKRYCDHVGLTLTQVAAFGDNRNDIEMIEGSGLGICMDNGDPSVREIADIIAPHHNEDGFASIIDRLLPR